MRVKTYQEKKTGNVYLSVTSNKKRFLVSTGLNSDKKFEGTDIPGSAAKRHRLRQIVNEVEDYINMHPDETQRQLKKHLKSLISGSTMDDYILSGIVAKYGELKPTEGTKSIYLLTSRRIDAYDKGVTLNEVDHEWLDGFYKHEAKKGRMVNGIAIDMRNIRAAFNWAIDNELTDRYPFRRYKIKQEETRKRCLTDEQIRSLKEHRGHTYPDIFFLLTYLRGINMSDLLMAKKGQVKDGRLEYRRNKTGQFFSVKIEPEAQAIIDKYKGTDHLLYVMDSSNDYHTFLHNFNVRICKIVPGISSYWSRHTVASIASRLDISVDIISRMLGHTDNLHKVTNIYIKFDESKVDAAMRKVIDYINAL
ncbi:MAG: site-specific integrase [Prevotella sp.]|jgi:integrase|nr:site-specific integrase [Prevotella sp.]